MGAQIALHCANAGVPAVLLDLTPDAARAGLDKARRLKPDPQFLPEVPSLVTTAGFDEGMGQLAHADWVIEAVVERLDIKQQLLARVDAARRPDRSSVPTPPGFRLERSPKVAATTSSATGLAHTSSTRRAISGCSK